MSSRDAVRNAKLMIKKIFSEIEANGEVYTRYPELEVGQEIDVENYHCSVCGLEDAPNNDILFCDKAGCNRLYHQRCLEPPVLSIGDEDEDWFCPICDCIEDCLEMVNEAFETSYADWRQVFPEMNRDEVANAVEDEDDEDDSYTPSVETGSQDDSSRDKLSDAGDEDYQTDSDQSDGSSGGIDEEEVQLLMQETEHSDLDRRLRRRAKVEEIDVFEQYKSPQDLMDVHVAKSIKGYLLRGKIIEYTNSDVEAHSLVLNSSELSGRAVPPSGWEGMWTVQFEYEKDTRRLNYEELRNALRLFVEFDKKISTIDESRKLHQLRAKNDVFLQFFVSIKRYNY